MDPTLDFLRDLVGINSINPSLVPGGAGEREAAARLADDLRDAGLDVHVVEVADGRANVIGIVEGREAGRTLMLCGHLDTVGVDGMDAPFTPVERDGRLYGRGAQDMKGGLAALAGAARILAGRSRLERGRVIVAGVIDEEHASLGAQALVRDWRADGAIVAEPTGLEIAIAHKGFVLMVVETRGRAAHGSRPDEGRDAILRMGRVLGSLEALDRELQSRPPQPLLGTASLHASMIDGGREWSTYPDACRLKLERRTVAGETPDRVLREVTTILEVLREADPEFEASASHELSRAAYAIDERAELPQLLAASARAAGLSEKMTGMTYWTDAAILGESGIPSVLFGPGGEGLHGQQEYVNVADVLTCRDVIADLARRFC
jgi:acetylornithine deacetylase/succinyl-diaminopimelate desuccinylase-like protein